MCTLPADEADQSTIAKSNEILAKALILNNQLHLD